MTEKAPEPHVEEEEDDLDGKLNYKPPPQKSLQELQEMDKDDESLTKYKKTLLGDGPVIAGVCTRMGVMWRVPDTYAFWLLSSRAKGKSTKSFQG